MTASQTLTSTPDAGLRGTRRSVRALLCAGVVAAWSVTSASAATLKVDDDGLQCPTAAYATIQAAVAAAVAGDTIKVCPGTYSGQVIINQALKIKGKAPKVRTCNTLAAPDPALHSIFEAPPVTGVAGIGFDVFADKVTIEGLVITHAGETGIRTDPAFGLFTLKKSVLVDNANGIYFHSFANKKSTVKYNCFRNSTAAGIRTRYGLYGAAISRNFFYGTTGGAALVVDQEPPAKSERLTVSRNKSQNDSTFAVILGTLDSVFSRNTVDTTTGTAFFVGGNNYNLAIKNNTVTNAGTRGIRFNIAAFPILPVNSPSIGVHVLSNKIDKAGSHGIAVDAQSNLSSLQSSIIANNTITNSGQTGVGDGIRIEDAVPPGANFGNRIEFNTISGSFNHDCHDATGPQNNWTSNTATTQNVADLCFSGAANGVAD